MRELARGLALAGLLLCAPVAAAQTIDAPLRVRTDEVYTISVEQTQTSEIAGQGVEATLSHSYALHIVDAEQQIWRYVPATISYTMPTGLPTPIEATDLNWNIINDATSALLRASMDIGFECRVDERGRCVDVTNWGMWRDRAENIVLMADAFARLVPEPAPAADPEIEEAPARAPKSDEDEEAAGMAATPALSWARMREPVLRGVAVLLDNFDSRDAAGALATIQPSAFLQGRTLTRRQPVAVADEFEMPFGAPPLRFTGTVQLDRVNQRDNTATIIRRVTLDEASARAALRGMSQFMTTNIVQPIAESTGEGQSAAAFTSLIEPMLEALSMRYEETTTGVLDLSTGMVRETTTQYTMTVVPTESAGDTPITVSGRTVIRITPGMPAVQRLPRP